MEGRRGEGGKPGASEGKEEAGEERGRARGRIGKGVGERTGGGGRFIGLLNLEGRRKRGKMGNMEKRKVKDKRGEGEGVKS